MHGVKKQTTVSTETRKGRKKTSNRVESYLRQQIHGGGDSEEAATLSPRASPPPKLSEDPRSRSGSSSAVARPSVRTRRSRRPRSSSSSKPLRRSCREPRVRLRDPRLMPVTRNLWPPHCAAVLHLATTCSDRSRIPPVPRPEAFGDVVGDQLSPPGVGTRISLLGHGVCHLVHGEWLVRWGVRFQDLT